MCLNWIELLVSVESIRTESPAQFIGGHDSSMAPSDGSAMVHCWSWKNFGKRNSFKLRIDILRWIKCQMKETIYVFCKMLSKWAKTFKMVIFQIPDA